MLCRKLRPRRPASQDRLVWASRKNIVITGVPDRGRRYISDFYTTLIDIRWRWNLLFFVVGFVLTWVLFAIYYYLLCVLHGDMEPVHQHENSTWIPCVQNVHTFTQAYLFSIETMSTIGYGWRYQTEECPGVYLAVMLQSVIGAGLQFALASLVVSKTRRANRFSQTILFSNTAVIFQEDGQLKLAVRIGDMRKGDVIGAHATGMLIKKTTGKTGHKVPVRMFTVSFEAEGGRQKLFLCWPCLLVHSIDQHSPFWTLSRQQLMNNMYELIVILDGVAATTSKPFQARKSYHSHEIVWGSRFQLLAINEDDPTSCGYVVDYNTFHHTHPVPTPVCSAQTQEISRLLQELNAECEGSDEEDGSEQLEASSEFTGHSLRSLSGYDSIEELEDGELGVYSDEEIEGEQTPSPVSARSKYSESGNKATILKYRETQTEDTNCKHSETQTEAAKSKYAKNEPGATKSKYIEAETASTKSKVTEAETASTKSRASSDGKQSPKPRGSDPEPPETVQTEAAQPDTVSPTRERVRKISRVEFKTFPDIEESSVEEQPNSVSSDLAQSETSLEDSESPRPLHTTTRVRKTSRVEFQPFSALPEIQVDGDEPASLNTSESNITRADSDMIKPVYVPAKDRVRRISRVELQPIVIKGPQSERRVSLGEAVNMYRHRRSVTDTYLGTELPDDDHDDSEANAAILSIVSQQNRVQEVKEVKARRKSSTQQLMFGTEGLDSETHNS